MDSLLSGFFQKPLNLKFFWAHVTKICLGIPHRVTIINIDEQAVHLTPEKVFLNLLKGTLNNCFYNNLILDWEHFYAATRF